MPVDNLCKQFGPRQDLTKYQARSRSKLFDTLMVFLSEITIKKRLILKKKVNSEELEDLT